MSSSPPSSNTPPPTPQRKSPSFSAEAYKEWLSPPPIKLPTPHREIMFADTSTPLFQRLENLEESDGLELYQLTLQAEKFRLESSLHRLLATQTLESPHTWRHLLQGIRRTLRQMHGRVLLCHEPGLGATLGLTLTLAEYFLRGLVSRILVVVPRSTLGYWAQMLSSTVGQPFAVSSTWPTAALPDHLLLPFDALNTPLPPEQLPPASYPLIAVSLADPLRHRKSQAWRHLLALSPTYLLLHTAYPFLSHPAELHGLLTLLGVPELPPAARLKRMVGGNDTPISPLTRQELQPFLQPVVLRNQVSNTHLTWPERQWKAQDIEYHNSFLQLRQEIWDWLRQQTPAPSAETSPEDTDSSPPGASSPSTSLYQRFEPLLQATFCSIAATAIELSHLAHHPDQSDMQHTLDTWKQRAAELATKDNRIRYIQAWLQENPRARFLIFCHHQATQTLLLERLKEFLVESSPQARVFVATDHDIPKIQGSIDCVVHFDLPWNLLQIDARSHWLLHPTHTTRHIRYFTPQQTPESLWIQAWQQRFKPPQLLPEELTALDTLLPESWRSPLLMWNFLHASSVDDFFQLLSKEYLQTYRLSRQILDQNQRMFLDDYTL